MTQTARTGSRMEGSSRPSLRDVFLREGPFVLRTARRLGVREADVEDVAQEVFVVLHRRYDDYDPTKSLRSWLFGIVRRVVADHRRLARVRNESPSAHVIQLSTCSPDQERALDRAAARRLLDEALESLSEEQRAVFVLYELEGMAMREVVDAIGCPLQTGYSRLHAAREAVHRFVETRRARRP